MTCLPPNHSNNILTILPFTTNLLAHVANCVKQAEQGLYLKVSWFIFIYFARLAIFFMRPDKHPFILLNHTADLGMMVTGKSLGQLFEKAALSMMQIIIKKRPAGKVNTVSLSLDGEDLADLLVRWLGEVLYLFEGEKEVLTHAEIGPISRSHLDATLRVTPFCPDRHQVLNEIKAVTYHQIEVLRRGGLWEAKIFFDL